MYKNIYDIFRHWYHGGSIYFYSDPHFGDEEMKTIRRNYIGDEEQVRRINSKVGKNDTIIFLGDIGDIEVVKKIRGYKVLILGNHDKGATGYKRIHQDVITTEDEHLPIRVDNYLFDEVYEGMLMISDKIILSHEPVNFPFAYNIHGHTHGSPKFPDSMHCNVCAEAIDYMPVSLKEIVNSGVLKNVPNIHRECIDKATERKIDINKR